jgi:hypothetical protein
MDSNKIHGPTVQKTATQPPDRFWMSTVSTIPIDSDIILTWDQWHWKAFLLSFLCICRTSNLDSVCDLSDVSKVAWSKTLSWSRI